MTFDVAFIGCNSMDVHGFYTAIEEEALSKAAMARQSRTVILVADGAKFRTPDFARIGSWDMIHSLITDGPVPLNILSTLHAKSVELVLV